MKKVLIALLVCMATGWPALSSASLSTLSNLFVFGDSLSDGGNSGLLTYTATGGAIAFPPPPYYQGPYPYPNNNQSHYSNGQVAVEYLWNLYHPGDTTFKPSLAGGTNYAIGGATTGTGNYNSVNPNLVLPTDPPTDLRPLFTGIGSAWQLDEFAKALVQPQPFDPATSLFVVWQFPNDLFYAAQTGQLPGQVTGSPGGDTVVANGIANIVTIIRTLAAAGAGHVLVPNMVDLGVTPEFNRSASSAALTEVSQLFNAYLASALTGLDDSLGNVEIVQFDTFGALRSLIANPGAYGLTNTTDACFTGAATCANPDAWLFWDVAHPTTRVHEILGAMMFNAVPEPATLWLFMSGVFGALVWRRGSCAGRA